MRQVIKLTESDLHKIIKESVNKILREGWNSNLSPDALDDKAYMNDLWAEREKMMQDDWERRNIAIRKKYPGKSREWYEAMLDTFYENKMNYNKAINEAHGEPDPCVALLYDSIIEDYQAAEIAEEYGISEEEAAAMWFKEVGIEMDIAEDEMPLHREFVCKVPELGAELYHDYGAGYYFLIKGQFNENTIKEATAGGGASGGLIGFSSNIGNGSGIAAGTTNTQNTPQGNGDNTIFGKGLTSKNKKKSNTDIINHGRDIYNARGDGKSSDNENSDFFGDTTKRKNGKDGSISIPKHRV